jgi:hypothetical protein
MRAVSEQVFQLVVAACGLLLVPAAAAAQSHSGLGAHDAMPRSVEPAVIGSCAPARINFIATNTTDRKTRSAEFVNVPQASVSFNQRADGCVVVHFSAVVLARTIFDQPQRIVIRAVLDEGQKIAVPRDVQLSGDDDEEGDGRWARAHSMFFVFPEVPSGIHKMNLQWKSPEGGDVFIHQHTVLVHHE